MLLELEANVEIWDLYDESRRLTGKTMERGGKKEKGYYHLVVDIFFLNSKGETLLQLRSKEKKNHPDAWCCTGGAAVQGEDSKIACIRECEEELGFTPDMANARILYTETSCEGCYIQDNYLIYQDMPVEKMKFQPEEVQDALWILPEKIKENEKMQRDMCSWANWKKVYPILCLESMRIRIPKGIYCHYKGNRYQVEGVALHSETLEPMVIYRALYGMEETWVRPASMWLEWIEIDGKRVRRFKKEE